jgi:3-oxoadipate enol-lactonase
MRKLVAWQGGDPLLVDDDGTGNGLICLHGLGGGSYFFSGLTKALRNSRRILSFDMPGTGFNEECVAAFSIEACVEATVEMIDQCKPERVSLLGHSMGTIVALKAYAERPDAIESLIFLGGLPQPVPAICQKLIARIEKIGKVGMSGIGEEVMPGIFAERTLRERGQLVGTYQRLLELNSEKSYIESIQCLVATSATDVVETVRVPCLGITGEMDLYAAPYDVEAFLALISAETTFEVFEDCAHMIFYEAPNRLYNKVSTFLHSLSGDWDYTYGGEE